ncbi:hypothetical protein SEA_DIZZYRUDY_73 [Microbacterium phage DizzyRudy]|nr:hypothetical protein SEA_DIZZYRUDY_73 [Microbacterium phage DizzyRudy]WMI34507.1 hypothetical protein SEA_DAMASCUS_70 [Microbacterium phage Damascus]
MKCPVCGHPILAGEYVVKRFLMGDDNKVERREPDYQHADCHDPRSVFHS